MSHNQAFIAHQESNLQESHQRIVYAAAVLQRRAARLVVEVGTKDDLNTALAPSDLNATLSDIQTSLDELRRAQRDHDLAYARLSGARA